MFVGPRFVVGTDLSLSNGDFFWCLISLDVFGGSLTSGGVSLAGLNSGPIGFGDFMGGRVADGVLVSPLTGIFYGVFSVGPLELALGC